jgi:hypothetical protein
MVRGYKKVLGAKCWVLGFLLVTCHSSLATGLSAQQPQAQTGQPLYAVNAKYVNGVAPGYRPTAGTGLVLNLSAGTSYCGNPPVPVFYAGGTLTMTNAATNYVYLDPVASCVPAKNTTGFTAGVIPLAQVVAAGGVITGVTDVRTWFVDPNSLGSIIRADLMPGADAGAKIAAAITALLVISPTGGTVDARRLDGAQTIAQNVFAGVTKPVRLLLGASSVASPYTITVGQVVTVGGTSIEGLGRHATTLSYTPNTGTAITISVPVSGDLSNAKLEGFSLYGPGKAVGAVTGIAITDGVGFRLSDLYLNGFSVDGIAVTGDVGLGTNTNMGSADGVFVRDAGTNGIRIEGNNSNVLHMVNLDVRGSGVGLSLRAVTDYPLGNFFHGHFMANTTNLLIESKRNIFQVYLEPHVLTTWQIDFTATSSHNIVQLLNTSEPAKFRSLGAINNINWGPNQSTVYATEPAALQRAQYAWIHLLETVAPNAQQMTAQQNQLTVDAANTQNWTNANGLSAQYAVFEIEVGAAGTITQGGSSLARRIIGAGTVSNSFGYRVLAPTGAGTITNNRSFIADTGAGIAEIADGIKTAKFVISGVNTVTFSATPTFDASLGNTQKITLTDNVTSSTLSNVSNGQQIDFLICQDGTGSRTFVWPTNVLGGMTIGATLSKCSAQNFIFDGTNAYALSAGVTNM